MKTAGERLREERERRGLTIEEAARLTKIRVEQIRDLEDNDFSNFPSLVYAKSFLKLYGKFLKVDLADTLEFFDPAPMHNEGVLFFKRPIAFAGRAKVPAPGRARGRGGEIDLSAPRGGLPRSGGGGLLWGLGVLMLIGVLVAVKFSIDLARLSKPSPATPADAGQSGQAASAAPAGGAAMPSVTPAQIVAEGPVPVAGIDDQLAQGSAEPVVRAEPVIRAEPVVRAEPAGRAPAPAAPAPPPAVPEPVLQPFTPGSAAPANPAEVRRAERVERAVPAPPRPGRQN